MKDIFLYIIIGITTAFFGCIFAVFVAEMLLNALPLAEMFVAGLLIYLCIVVVFCTCLIIKKLNNVRNSNQKNG
ncbi:MAG: hypothetical protein FH761_08285 [Firmicutes bacterium]|nr:hypothetical protein [Bacillota bacterium]